MMQSEMLQKIRQLVKKKKVIWQASLFTNLRSIMLKPSWHMFFYQTNFRQNL